MSRELIAFRCPDKVKEALDAEIKRTNKSKTEVIVTLLERALGLSCDNPSLDVNDTELLIDRKLEKLEHDVRELVDRLVHKHLTPYIALEQRLNALEISSNSEKIQTHQEEESTSQNIKNNADSGMKIAKAYQIAANRGYKGNQNKFKEDFNQLLDKSLPLVINGIERRKTGRTNKYNKYGYFDVTEIAVS
jgi:hypothetical protein